LNNDYYVFDLSETQNIQWSKLTTGGTGNPKSPAVQITKPKMQLPTQSDQGSPNKIVIIISLSAGLIVIALVVVVVFTLIYRRIMKKKSDPDTFNDQIPSDK
jgi:hypothetical protein